jgi:MYXO-CTERM domain-containing protein
MKWEVRHRHEGGMIDAVRFLVSLFAFVALTLVLSPSASAHGRFPELGRISFHPTDDDIYLVRGTFGLVVTTDGGATFQWICPTVFSGRWTEDPAITIADDGSFIVGIFDGLSRSPDGGCNWSMPSTDLTEEVVIDVARTADATRLFALQSSGGTDNGLWSSTDSGATWAATNPAIDSILFETVEVAPSDAMRVYLTGAYPPSVEMPRRPYVYASTDGGVTFDSVAFTDFRDGDRNVYLLGVDPLDPDRLLILVRATMEDRIYESTDAGATFDEIFTLPTLDGFAWSEDGMTVWLGSGTNTTLYRSTNGGSTFDVLRDDVSVSCLGVRGDELFVCADNFADGYALGRSTDDGVTIDPLFVFADIDGIVECSGDADAPTVCTDELDDLARDLGLADGGMPDGGADGSVDAGADGGVDAGADDAGGDAGSDPGDDGCNCHAAGAGRELDGGWVALSVLALLFWRRRRADRQR